MKAVDIKNKVGGADALFINHDVPTPIPAAGELLVKVKAFGLNRMDVMQRNGQYPLPPQASEILGVEFSGVVEAVGSGGGSGDGGDGGDGDGGQFKPGDEVFGLTYGGAYAEFVAVSAKMCIHKPATLSHEKAAGIPEVWITATQSLWTVGGFQPGKKVLIHAGASGVGVAAIQLAVRGGAAAVFATASSAEKLEFCTKTLGATAGLNYKTQDFAQEILAATDGQGVDVIVDPVGQSHFQKDLAAAAKDGCVVLLAMMSGAVAREVNLAPILSKRLRIEGSTLRSRGLAYQQQLRDKLVEEALPGIVDGTLKVFVERVFDWKDIADAHELMESNRTQGKIVCTVG